MPSTPPQPAYPPSETGYWEVKLSRGKVLNDYFYNPGMSRIVVDESTLTLMLADIGDDSNGNTALVANVVAAD